MPRLPALFERTTVALVAALLAAMLIPCRGAAATAVDGISKFAIAALFFLYGARLLRRSIIARLTHLRLNPLMLACTFIAFPRLWLTLKCFSPGQWMKPEFAAGKSFLCALPSTVRSSIAFT